MADEHMSSTEGDGNVELVVMVEIKLADVTNNSEVVLFRYIKIQILSG